MTESFCGVGNPLGLGEVRPGQTVLDLGSGAGLDSLLAARRVGPTGKVVGVDLCPEMVEKARRNADLLGLQQRRVRAAEIERLPLPDASVDVVISNGVFNLCPDKPGVLAEAFRVLRPGGRLQMADILLHDDVTPEEVAQQGRVVGLNRRCRVGAVAPANAGRGRVCRGPHPRLDRLPHVVLHRRGARHGQETSVSEPGIRGATCNSRR